MGKIVFHHIPKTAGTALVEHASAAFGDAVCPARYDAQLSEDAILDRRFAFYHGHFTRATVMRFRELVPDAFIFTFVRHPFGRTLSQYYNWHDPLRVRREFDVIAEMSGSTDALRRLRATFEHKIFHMSLDAFLESDDPVVAQAINNLQAQYMTDVVGLADHRRFNRATVSAIGTYDFIGIQELYAPCLRILESKCLLPEGFLGGAARRNASDDAKVDGRYRVTPRQLALLEGRNVYDLALYQACYGLLLKQYGPWLPEDAADIDSVADLPDVIEDRAIT